MDMKIRDMTPEEIKYSYSQSQQLRTQCGSIGHLRGDFGSKGYEFYTTWDDHNTQLKTDFFKSELDEVINALRSDEYGLLKDRYAMGEFRRRPKAPLRGIIQRSMDSERTRRNMPTCCAAIPFREITIFTASVINQNGWTGI